jgi:hypothetical protein
MATPKTALISRAGEFDTASTYLSTFGTKLVQYAKDNGYNVTELYNDDLTLPARETTFTAEIEKKPSLFIGMGHGNETVFTGMDMEILLQAGVNDDLASGIPSYLWACHTATTLGPDMVAKTCPVYFGYAADWTFNYHPDYVNPPSSDDPPADEKCTFNDPYAKAFFDAGLATGYSTILGKTPQQIYQDTIDRYNYWWNYWLGQEDSMADSILTQLANDRDNFMVITPTGIYQEPPPTLNLGTLIPIGLGAALLLIISR